MGLESSSLTFPTSPVIGQTEDFQGKTWEWNGLGWRRVTPTFQSTPFVLPAAKQWIALNAAYTLVSQTAAQSMFPTGGLLLTGNRTYLFECRFSLTSMSGTTGNGGFALGGTATITRQAWWANAADKSTLATPATGADEGFLTFSTAANTLLSINATNTTMTAWISGILRVGAGGTIIPQISQTTAAAAVVSIDSYFWIEPIGMDTQQSSDT